MDWLRTLLATNPQQNATLYLVLNSAGKPIFTNLDSISASRDGGEESNHLIGLSAVLQTIFSIHEKQVTVDQFISISVPNDLTITAVAQASLYAVSIQLSRENGYPLEKKMQLGLLLDRTIGCVSQVGLDELFSEHGYGFDFGPLLDRDALDWACTFATNSCPNILDMNIDINSSQLEADLSNIVSIALEASINQHSVLSVILIDNVSILHISILSKAAISGSDINYLSHVARKTNVTLFMPICLPSLDPNGFAHLLISPSETSQPKPMWWIIVFQKFEEYDQLNLLRDQLDYALSAFWSAKESCTLTQSTWPFWLVSKHDFHQTAIVWFDPKAIIARLFNYGNLSKFELVRIISILGSISRKNPTCISITKEDWNKRICIEWHPSKLGASGTIYSIKIVELE